MFRFPRWVFGIVCLFGVAHLAYAQEPAVPAAMCPATRHVLLVPHEGLPEALIVEVSADLAAELEPRGLALCAGSESADAAAVVHLTMSDKHASIELDDRTTQKRVARDVRIDRIPQNGRALAIAIAIDELLRASWAELTMREETLVVEPVVPRAEVTPAPVVTAPPRPKLRERKVRVGASLGSLHGRDRFHALSLGVTGDLNLRVLWLHARLLPLVTWPVREPAGRVTSYGVEGALGLGACFFPRTRVRLCGGPSLAAAGLWFHGDGRGDVRGARERGTLLRVEGLAGASFGLGERVSLSLLLGVGGALSGLRIRDGRDTLLAAEGLLFSSQLGLEVWL